MNKEEALKKIEELKKFVENCDKEETYKRGDILMNTDDNCLYIIAQITNNACILICLSNTHVITRQELRCMTSGYSNFKKVNVVIEV